MTDLKQIGRGSSAASTAFCSERIDGPGGLWIYVDGNDKVTRENGAYGAPTPNAFSLLAGNGEDPLAPGHEREHCPGSTPTCRGSCYVHGLEKAAGSTYALYAHNSAAIREILALPDGGAAWAEVLADYVRHKADGGFRWHVSGDVFSRSYGFWIAQVCDLSLGVDHWIYTRSFAPDPTVLDGLYDASTAHGGNLAVNLSCDRDNYQAARTFRETFEYGRLCYLTADGAVPADLPEGSVIFPDYALRAPPAVSAHVQRRDSDWWQGLTGDQRRMTCPTDYYGKSARNRCGPCSRCLT